MKGSLKKAIFWTVLLTNVIFATQVLLFLGMFLLNSAIFTSLTTTFSGELGSYYLKAIQFVVKEIINLRRSGFWDGIIRIIKLMFIVLSVFVVIKAVTVKIIRFIINSRPAGKIYDFLLENNNKQIRDRHILSDDNITLLTDCFNC